MKIDASVIKMIQFHKSFNWIFTKMNIFVKMKKSLKKVKIYDLLNLKEHYCFKGVELAKDMRYDQKF